MNQDGKTKSSIGFSIKSNETQKLLNKKAEDNNFKDMLLINTLQQDGIKNYALKAILDLRILCYLKM